MRIIQKKNDRVGQVAEKDLMLTQQLAGKRGIEQAIWIKCLKLVKKVQATQRMAGL